MPDLSAAGLPAGRLNVVTGPGAELGDALAADPRVRVRLEPLGIQADAWKREPALDPAAMPPVGAA